MKNNRILIIEDDIFIAEALQELLESEGYEVVCAVNGQHGLEQLRSNPLPAVIFLDLMMPVKDGFQFREEQKIDPSISDIPVVVMSADGNVAEKKARIGAHEYLKKPVDLDSYLAIARRFCS